MLSIIFLISCFETFVLLRYSEHKLTNLFPICTLQAMASKSVSNSRGINGISLLIAKHTPPPFLPTLSFLISSYPLNVALFCCSHVSCNARITGNFSFISSCILTNLAKKLYTFHCIIV